MFEDKDTQKSRELFLKYMQKPKAPFEEVKAWCSYAGKALWMLKWSPESEQYRLYRDLKMNMPEAFNHEQVEECHKFISEVYNRVPCSPEIDELDY